MNNGKREYWIFVREGSNPEWGLLRHCVQLAGKDLTPAVLTGNTDLAPTAFGHGAGRVYMLQGSADPRRIGYQIAQLAADERPEAILFTADEYGRMVSATAAALLHTGLAADCIRIERRSDGLLVMTRPAFGGTLYADIICPNQRPQMATVRPGAYLADLLPESNAEGMIQPVKQGNTIREPVLVSREKNSRKDLLLSKIIIAGGRGVGSREGFLLLEELADVLGASVGASRAAVNAGYASYDKQIGLTGQIVKPKVYLAVGISGAVQHVVGMERSGIIIAVNTDAGAPIFDYADYGIVGDWQKTVREMLTHLTSPSA